MPRARVTEKDPSLPHQINLVFKPGYALITLVMCNCRSEPLGEISHTGDPWPIFNNPINHEGPVPFVPGQSTAKVFDVE